MSLVVSVAALPSSPIFGVVATMYVALVIVLPVAGGALTEGMRWIDGQ